MTDLSNDIIKYKKGELSATEMHALEKRALTDPFLAEALEGIEPLSGHALSADVTELNKKISDRKKNKWIIPLRVAAGVALVAGALLAIYQFTPPPETLALKTEPPQPVASTPAQPPAENSEKAEKKLPASPTEPVKAEENLLPKQSPQLKNENLVLPPISTETSAEEKEHMAAGAELKTEEPVVTKNVLSPATQEAASSSELVKKKESLTRGTRSFAKKSIHSGQPDTAQLSSSPVFSFEKNMDRDEVEKKSALPSGGIKAYSKYVEDNLRYPENARQNNIGGKVILEFTVSTNGQPDRFKIIKSVGYGCDEEAMRLVKDGPSWIPFGRNNQPYESTVRISLRFDPAKHQ
ncbi:MAG: TonB family protein [Bacteroidetes bacterium]|nr:TonB family protein [Bacteroidota bacterium]